MDVALENVADAYLHYCEDQRDEDFWATEEVDRRVSSSCQDGWAITSLLLTKADTDHALGCVAAGPLENLICGYGDEALDTIERAADRNSRIQLALNLVCLEFYLNVFERWYRLLHKYGFREDRLADPAVIGKAMSLIDSYLNEGIHVYDYHYSMTELLDKPLADKAAQRILQRTAADVEHKDAKRPPEYREPYMTRAELKDRVRQVLSELESLGYNAAPE